MSRNPDHLTNDQLHSFAAGKCTNDEWHSIEQHLAICEECAHRIEELPPTDDRFLTAIKEARDDSAPRAQSVASTQSRRNAEQATTGHGGGTSEVLEAGTSFGRYTLREPLGKGAFATVYRADDHKLGRQVALKVLDGRAGTLDVRRFLREARAAGGVNHKNICPIYDMGQTDGHRYIAMGLVEGQTLCAYLDSGKTVTTKQAVLAVFKLASALIEAHDQGIVHRDLKPANIMIDSKRRELVILDFGLAQRMDSKGARLTHAGDVLGTPVYMAPEQVHGDVESIGPQTDVYALGVILYELLAGRRPFVGSIAGVFAQILYGDPEVPSTFCPGISPALDAICLTALAKDQGIRYQSMQAFRAALVDFLKGKDVALAGETPSLIGKNKIDWSPPPDFRKVPEDDGAPSLSLTSDPQSVQQANTTCPECQAQLPPGKLLCEECGFHQGLRHRFDAFAKLPAESHHGRGWGVNQLCEGETPESVAVGIMMVLPIVVVLTIWLISSVSMWVALASAVILVVLVISVLKTLGWRMDPQSGLLYLYRLRRWRPLRPPWGRKVLDMRGTNANDRDLQSLKKEWMVEVLDLEDALVTDDGIEVLASLNNLKFLVLRGTLVSREGFEDLKRRLPNTRIWC